MQRLREILLALPRHRAFAPALIGIIAITLGIVLGFEHSRNIIKVRGPYLFVLAVIACAPIFAFRFFDPHEPWRPIGFYFVATAIYYMTLGTPNMVGFFTKLVGGRVNGLTIQQLLFGFLAFAAVAGCIDFSLKLFAKSEETPRGFLAVSPLKLLIYAILHIIYLNLAVSMVRLQFGMYFA